MTTYLVHLLVGGGPGGRGRGELLIEAKPGEHER